MPRIPYVPPEIDPNNRQNYPHAALGELMLQPGMTIVDVPAFNALDAVQEATIRSLFTDEIHADKIPKLEARLQRATISNANVGMPLGNLLRPHNFRGRIIDGAVHVLEFEQKRFGSYGAQTKELQVQNALSLLIVGKLTSTGDKQVQAPFEQEVAYCSYYRFNSDLSLKRMPGPTQSLKEAAALIEQSQRRSRRVGAYTEGLRRAVRPKGNSGFSKDT